jgi:hypothetical protein
MVPYELAEEVIRTDFYSSLTAAEWCLEWEEELLPAGRDGL